VTVEPAKVVSVDGASFAVWRSGEGPLGHSYGGMCALEAALLTDRIGKLILYEPPMGFLKSPPHVVDRLQTLLEQGARDELLGYFMQQVAGLPEDQIELMRSLPAWQARLDTVDTIPRDERASREYVFDPARFGTLPCRRCSCKAATATCRSSRPVRRCKALCRTAAWS
jgi:pimeloyl-ACP methyl ester carboxylesterase